jgi:hypothetical protein
MTQDTLDAGDQTQDRWLGEVGEIDSTLETAQERGLVQLEARRLRHHEHARRRRVQV